MLGKLALFLCVPPALLLGTVLVTDTALVSVNIEDGPRFFVPVPLTAVGFAASFVPEAETEIDVSEWIAYKESIQDVIRELVKAEDGSLVKVEDGQTLVRVEKKGSILHVNVHDGETIVEAKFPMKAANRILDSLADGVVRPQEILKAISGGSYGKVCHVRDGETEIKVWIL